MNHPTVFIIDDDPSVRTGISRLLKASGIQVEAFGSANDFLEADAFDSHGCIILDVHMPEMTGPELHARLIEEGCGLPVIFLTAHGTAATATRAMKKGAVDFLEKPVNREELLDVVGQSFIKDLEKRKQREEKHAIDSTMESLTPREHEVMTYVISGLLNKQIAAEMQISEETVKIHRGRVMQKLGIVSVAELVRLCEKAGIDPRAGGNQLG